MMNKLFSWRGGIFLGFSVLLLVFYFLNLKEAKVRKVSFGDIKTELVQDVHADSFSFPDNSFDPSAITWTYDSGWLDMNSLGDCGSDCQCVDDRRISSDTDNCASSGYHTKCRWVHDSAIAVVDYYLDTPFESSSDCLATVLVDYSDEIFGEENETFRISVNGTEAYFPDQEAGEHQVTSTEPLTLNRGWNRVYFLATGWCDGSSNSVHFGVEGEGQDGMRFRCDRQSSQVKMNVNFTNPINPGESAVIDWDVEGATSCSTSLGDAGWQALDDKNLPFSGYYESSALNSDTTFKITCQDSFGDFEEREFVVEVQNLQGLSISFYPDDYSIYTGDSVGINWEVQGAEGCYGWSDIEDASWPSGSRNATGGRVIATPGTSTEYYLRCANATTGVSLVRDFKVVVSDAPVINNACGTQDDTASCEKPTSDLCVNGGESEVVFNDSNGYWEWSCTDDTSGLVFDCGSKFYCSTDLMKWRER